MHTFQVGHKILGQAALNAKIRSYESISITRCIFKFDFMWTKSFESEIPFYKYKWVNYC